jgi:tetratricopeptide (TPR) repeat protein
MPDRDIADASGLTACPECGHMNPANTPVCSQCGMELYLDQLGPENFEEFDEGAHDEGPEADGFEEVTEVEGPAADMRGVPRATARAVPGRPLPGPPRAGLPPPPRMVPPPGQPRGYPAPGQRPGAPAPPGQVGLMPGAVPQAPAKPQAPIDYTVKREQVMYKFTLYIVILGVVNLIMGYAVPSIMALAGQYTTIWAGNVLLNIVVMGLIIAFALYTGGMVEKSPDKTTLIEDKNLGRINMGIGALLLIFVIQVLGINRAIPGLPDPGNYNTGWSFIYMLFAFPGIVWLAKGLYTMREKLSYFKVWRFGLWTLVLAPVTGAIDALSPVAVPVGTTILNYQSYFASSLSALFLVVVVIAFGLKQRLGGMYKALEDETKRGEDLFKAGRYREAMESFDRAIDDGHELFSQYFYDPDAPRLSTVRLPSQYGIPWLRKGDIFVQLRKPRKAIAIYDVILELDPKNEVVWNRKGEVLLSMGKFQDAIRCFDQALSAVPAYQKAVQNRQKAQALLAKVAEALTNPDGGSGEGPTIEFGEG